MITMTIIMEEATLPGGGLGVGLKVITTGRDAATCTEQESVVWYELSQAINRHMKAQGAHNFDCLRMQAGNGPAGVH